MSEPNEEQMFLPYRFNCPTLISFSEGLVELAKLDATQVEMFDDDSRSCFCHD